MEEAIRPDSQRCKPRDKINQLQNYILMEVLILQGFGKNVFTDPELADEAALIVECLTDNLLIPTPSPSGAAIQTVLTVYNLSRVQVRITRIEIGRAPCR